MTVVGSTGDGGCGVGSYETSLLALSCRGKGGLAGRWGHGDIARGEGVLTSAKGVVGLGGCGREAQEEEGE